ncbi:acetyl-CoA C-acyltransferase [Luteolibacter sp. LG18]|uniref:acetyl-CoA C-acyltransferase n=1 Tax=Luteolibacter sp. LG18 TaxID=2819286 RepID=UPI002B310D1F|nr:acetyl-CoA acetyltransferase [Luteolibacter sp. LG18]
MNLWILAGVRTPFLRAGTQFEPLGAADLGRMAISALLARTGVDPGAIDEVILGCVGQPADAANVARVAALRAGIPESVPAATVQRNCASGLESITSAYERMTAGRGELFLVGGMESMSRYPLLYSDSAMKKFGLMAKARSPFQKLAALAKFRPKDFAPRIGLKLGLTDPYTGMIMGETAELLAREYHITREEQDAFAANSHLKALAATETRNHEIAAAHLGGKAITADNGPREDSTPEKLAKLKPIFEPKWGGVTAGNSSQVSDGAVALLVGTEAAAARIGLVPMGRLTHYAYSGCDPARMGIGPVLASARAMKGGAPSPAEADIVELNEAFAAQALAVLKAFRDPAAAKLAGLDHALGEIALEKLNRRGGSIALGHPVGATGSRLVLTALDQLHETGGKRALVTLCVGGGQGAALWLERP